MTRLYRSSKRDGSAEILYARMNDIDLQVFFADPGDGFIFRFETAYSRQSDRVGDAQ